MVWNIISLIGTIVGVIGTAAGIIGTVISYKTMVNTNRIEETLKKERVKIMFKSEYSLITSSLANNIAFLNKKDVRRETITEIRQTVEKIKKYSVDNDWSSTDVVNKCANFIDDNFSKLLSNTTVKEGRTHTVPDEELNNELIKHLLDVQSAVEEENFNYDIRQN